MMIFDMKYTRREKISNDITLQLKIISKNDINYILISVQSSSIMVADNKN